MSAGPPEPFPREQEHAQPALPPNGGGGEGPTAEVSVLLHSWTRLEPAPRDPTLAEGLQARVADPAWLLARQAAFGELAGTDNAAPVVVRMRARATR